MSMVPAIIDITRYSAGDEISHSPTEPGSVVNVLESVLDTAETSSLPVRGKPCAVGTVVPAVSYATTPAVKVPTTQLTGIVLKTPSAAGEVIPVQTKGVFCLSVKGEDPSGNAALPVGSPVYIEPSGVAYLTGDYVAGTLFGYLLTAQTSGTTGNCAVLLK